MGSVNWLHLVGEFWQLTSVVVLTAIFMAQDARRWKVTESVLIGMLCSIVATVLWRLLDVQIADTWDLPLIGAVSFLVVGILIRSIGVHISGTEVFGPGDLVLAAFAGAFLGWKASLVWFLCGAVFGAAYWAFISLRRRRRARRRWNRLPAGPAFGFALILLYMATKTGIYQGYPFG